MNDTNEQCQPESSASARELDVHINCLKELRAMLPEENDQLNDTLQEEAYKSDIIYVLEYNDQLVSCIMKRGHQNLGIGNLSPLALQRHDPV